MLIHIIIATFLVSLSSLVGGVLLLWKKALTKHVLPYLISFATSVVLVVAFFDLLPEALEHGGEEVNIFVPAFFGIVVSFLVERLLLWFHHHDDSHKIEPSAVLILFGDGIHNFIDGVVIAVAFMSDAGLGIAITLAVAAHEIPHEIADFAVLIHGGMKKKKALFFNFVSSLAALAGGLGAFYFLQKIENGLPYLLAFSAGMFIYIACTDLIPDLNKNFEKDRRWGQTLIFLGGLIFTYLLLTSITHH